MYEQKKVKLYKTVIFRIYLCIVMLKPNFFDRFTFGIMKFIVEYYFHLKWKIGILIFELNFSVGLFIQHLES